MVVRTHLGVHHGKGRPQAASMENIVCQERKDNREGCQSTSRAGVSQTAWASWERIGALLGNVQKNMRARNHQTIAEVEMDESRADLNPPAGLDADI